MIKCYETDNVDYSIWLLPNNRRKACKKYELFNNIKQFQSLLKG